MNSDISIPRAVLDWLRETVGSKDCSLQLKPMKGAGSSSVTLLLLNDQPRYVLRLHTDHEWLLREPDLIAHEAAALEWISGEQLPCPRYVALQDSGPQALLMTLLPGDVVLQPSDRDHWLSALAESLAGIHRFKSVGFPWAYKSWTRLSKVKVPDWSKDPSAWQVALDRRNEEAPHYDPVFIHRDFHPLNVLWEDGQVSGIVDWVNGCSGPAAVDVAHCRMNLALMYGPEMADRFLAYYLHTSPGFEQDPFWDLDAVLGWLPEPFFYEPWAEFGLPRISVDLLSARMDAYLGSIVSRLG